MKTPVIAFAGMVLLASGLLAQNQPLPGMPIAAPPLMAQASDGTSLGTIPAQDGNDIANRIKLRGYIDMTYSDIEVDNEDQGTLGVKSVDLDFLFDFSPVTAEIHVQHEDTSTGTDVGIEQAFVTYAVNPNFNITFGRQRQLLGFEGDEATDQYLSTRTYFLGDNFDLYKTNELLAPGDTSLNVPAGTFLHSNFPTELTPPELESFTGFLGNLHHNYNDGIRANFNAGRFGLSVGLYDGIWGSDSEWTTSGFGDGEWGIDVQAAIVLIPGLEARVGYARHSEPDNGSDDIDQMNLWLSYQAGNLTLAGEFNDYDVMGIDGRSWMFLTHYSFTSRVAAAVRYSNENFDLFDSWKISVGPSIVLTDNLMLRLEYSFGESDVYGLGTLGGEQDVHMVMAEGLFTF